MLWFQRLREDAVCLSSLFWEADYIHSRLPAVSHQTFLSVRTMTSYQESTESICNSNDLKITG